MNPDLVEGTSGEGSGFDVVSLLADASGPGLVVLALLSVASVLVWIIWFAKFMQLSRLKGAARKFERACHEARDGREIMELSAAFPGAPGATVVRAIRGRISDLSLTPDLLTAVSKRAIAMEEQRASALMPTLSSIASASPFIGLFGTVWGIMIAFQRIGAEKSASLPVVAPAIGEALVATAFGLFAAIPATIGYNYIDRRIGDLMDELSAAADVWTARIYADEIHQRRQRGASKGV
jgi:biopolymer transport protein TolQ